MTSADRLLVDEILPRFDVSARYSVHIHAPGERVYAVVQRGIPLGVFTRVLLKLRNIPRMLRNRRSIPLSPNGFYKLKELENREIVVGIIGQFWKPVPQPVSIQGLEDFLRFETDGFCKAVMNFRIEDGPPGQCVVSTETRVIGYGGGAKARFREYWSLIGPFSGLIRREMLKKIKIEAEKQNRR